MKKQSKILRFGQRCISLLLAAVLTMGITSQSVLAAEKSNEIMADKLKGLEECGNWYFASGWEYNYAGAANSGIAPDNGMLKITADFHDDADKGYSKVSFSYWDHTILRFNNITKVVMDLYFDEENITTGSLRLAINSDALNVDDFDLNLNEAVAAQGNLKKLSVVMPCENAYGTAQTITVSLIGLNTDFAGSIWMDGIRFLPAGTDDVYVDATVDAKSATKISNTRGNSLSVNGTNYPYTTTVQIVDPDATSGTIALYQYLKAVGESDAVLYGHMEDTVLKAGSAKLSPSDTLDVTGSLSAINGLDCGGLFAGFASKYNSRHPGEEQLPDTNEGNIRAAALLSNEAIAGGAIMTLSAHMPNFAFTTVKDPAAKKTYDRYDYSPADSYNLNGDCMKQILPGGAFNPQYTAYLDLIAEYAQQVNGPILFRPLHENTGSWFWWGKAFCDAETYKSVFRYTVEYLRDEKQVHNFLYLYGPGSEAGTLEEYGERYPGDAYVDMVGFDTYDDQASAGEGYTFQRSFEATVALTDQFAKKHNKLFAVTETGITNSAMKKTDIQRPDWFTEILDIITKPTYNCAYFMVWSNYDAKSNYYSPYVSYKSDEGTLHGHALMDPFLNFFNNPKSIFASNQKSVISSDRRTPTASGWNNTGYITAPVGGARILEPTYIQARVGTGIQKASLTVSNGQVDIPLDTTLENNRVSASLTQEILDQLGETPNGKITLLSGREKLAEMSVVFNIPEKEADPLMVDDFESYYGEDAMMSAAWAGNKGSGCSMNLTLDDTTAQDGYSLKFEYTEASGGYAGATITKETNWSECDALQFWTIPDGKQQKTVIQIQANDTCYEVYLNLYPDYNARAGQPTLVTIPFSEFCQRDTAGNPKGGLVNDCAKVSSVGLWVNAIENTSFQGGSVSGTIWYDNITAVKSGANAVLFN